MRVCQRCGETAAASAERCGRCGFTAFMDLPGPGPQPDPRPHPTAAELAWQAVQRAPRPAEPPQPDAPIAPDAAARAPWPLARKLGVAAGALVLAPKLLTWAASLLLLFVPPTAAGSTAIAAAGLATVLAAFGVLGWAPLTGAGVACGAAAAIVAWRQRGGSGD